MRAGRLDCRSRNDCFCEILGEAPDGRSRLARAFDCGFEVLGEVAAATRSSESSLGDPSACDGHEILRLLSHSLLVRFREGLGRCSRPPVNALKAPNLPGGWACPWLDSRPGSAEAAAGSPSQINDTPQFFRLLSCENRKSPYIVAVRRKRRRAWRQGKGARRKFLIWNRCNPLISRDSDE
jgi:hypothetical protein